jgi:hypothetical protein
MMDVESDPSLPPASASFMTYASNRLAHKKIGKNSMVVVEVTYKAPSGPQRVPTVFRVTGFSGKEHLTIQYYHPTENRWEADVHLQSSGGHQTIRRDAFSIDSVVCVFRGNKVPKFVEEAIESRFHSVQVPDDDAAGW